METCHHRLCQICLEDLRQPKFLDCHHSFCLECLRALNTYSPKPLKCPVCKRTFQLPTGGVDHLTSNFYIKDTQPSEDEHEKVQVGHDKQQKKVSERKPIKLKFPSDLRWIESLGGVYFMFHLFKNNTDEWGETLALRLYLSKEKSPFVHSCQIEYHITLVNQKERKFSTKRTGHCSLLQITDDPYSTKCEIDLMKFSQVTDPDYGFITNKSDEVYTFSFLVGIILSNIKKVEFNLD